MLTEPQHFHGSLEYLRDTKKAQAATPLPLLRKDFIFNPYQIYEARAYGADCILLIVAILSPQKLAEILQLSRQLGMMNLVEVYNAAEAEIAVKSGVGIIGLNNRDLFTFKVDPKTASKLCPLIPPDRLVVSESGIKSHQDMVKLQQWGVNAALIGEALMSAPYITIKMKELL